MEQDKLKRRKSTEEARSSKMNFGIFKDMEMDWIFKRTLEEIVEKGAEIGECLAVAKRINEKDGSSWVLEWAKMAALVEANGDKSFKSGNKVSARECYLRACNYYRTAEYGALPEDPNFHKYWEKSRESFIKAGKLFDLPIENIEVNFEGKKLPGYFWQADKNETRPTLVAAGGGDSSGEEIAIWAGSAATRRGYNFFCFEHPGHKGAIHLYPDCIRRPDMEKPYNAAFDVIEKLPGVDERIALVGYSGGGYTAIRVAAFEKRVKALIPDSPLITPGELAYGNWPKFLNYVPLSWMDKLLEWKFFRSPMMYARWRWNELANGDYGLKFSEKFKKHVGSLKNGETLQHGMKRWYEKSVGLITDEMMARITCPVLALVGEDEGGLMIEQAKTFYDKVGSKNKKLHIFTLENDACMDHCQLDNISRGSQVIFDWLDGIFR